MNFQEFVTQNKIPIAIFMGAIIIAGAVYFSGSRTQPAPSKFVPVQDVNQYELLQPLSKTECLIKGNISSGGKIYHLPGCGSYDKTVIDENSGEKWFCSESEALVAGWRKAKNCP